MFYLLECDEMTQPFTAIVVTYNEAVRLRNCLDSLSFCDQILVVDLGSSDDSVNIAKKCNAEIIYRERLPIVERILPTIVPFPRNDWIIHLDPDEVFSNSLSTQENISV